MDIRFGVKPVTEFKILENGLKIKLLDGPSIDQLLEYIPQFVNSTWAEASVINKYIL